MRLRTVGLLRHAVTDECEAVLHPIARRGKTGWGSTRPLEHGTAFAQARALARVQQWYRRASRYIGCVSAQPPGGPSGGATSSASAGTSWVTTRARWRLGRSAPARPPPDP